MNTRVAISLPRELKNEIEKKRAESGLSRSEFIRDAIESFMGIDRSINKKLEAKYGPLYESLKNEDRKISKEMMSIASKSLDE